MPLKSEGNCEYIELFEGILAGKEPFSGFLSLSGANLLSDERNVFMKRIFSAILALAVIASLASCSGKTNLENRTLENYDEKGFYEVDPVDLTLMEYMAAPIPELLINNGQLNAEDIIYTENGDGTYKAASLDDFELRQENELAVPMYYYEGDDGLRKYPEQFIRYTCGDKYYYSVGDITEDSEYSQTSDGKKMVYKGNDVFLLLYNADDSSLTRIGDTEYDGRNADYFGKGWAIKFAINGDGKYLAFSSNRRTFEEGKSFDTDLWIRNMETGEETILAENVSIYSELYFIGNTLYYKMRDQETDEYSYIGTDVTSGQQITIPWNIGGSYIANVCIVGEKTIYDISAGRTTEFDSSYNNETVLGVLSTDKSKIATLHAADERLYINLTSLSEKSSIVFQLPAEFNENFINFDLIAMDGNKVYLQCATKNGDQGGQYTYYYVIDLTFFLENQ